MASSRRSSNPPEREAFPTLPPDGSDPYTESSQTTSTTTTTVIGGNSDPVITTTTYQPTSDPTTVPPIIHTTNDPNTAPSPYSRTTLTVPNQIPRRAISIRRLPSNQNIRGPGGDSDGAPSRSGSGRARASSAPQEPHLAAGGGSTRLTRASTRQSLAPVSEEYNSLQVPGQEVPQEQPTTPGVGRRRSVSNAARSIISKFSDHDDQGPAGHDYEDEVVDYLDVLDPEVQTLTTLTNVQNSLFVPNLGRWLNRRPTYTLSRAPSRITEVDSSTVTPTMTMEQQHPKTPTVPEQPEEEEQDLSQIPTAQRSWSYQRRPAPERSHTISSVMTESHYAVLPHGVNLEGWTEEDKENLDDHVRHMLHSRRSKFKQRMRAFRKYISKPLGFFVTLYATLITLFGLTWVLFLIGWINVGGRQNYIINIVDNVLVALFAIMGDGLAPFRCVDTYHMIFIARYGTMTWRIRKEQGFPQLNDINDLPERSEKEADPEAGKAQEAEFTVLTPERQKKLAHHQSKFAKSHSFYKPHETTTHYAFPLKLLITIVTLLDCHSILQIMLGAFTWGWSYHTRPDWITAVILSCSIAVNITAGILISVGDRKTRKKDVILRMTRQDITAQAIKKVKKHKADREAALQHAQHSENFQVIQEETEPTRSMDRTRS